MLYTVLFLILAILTAHSDFTECAKNSLENLSKQNVTIAFKAKNNIHNDPIAIGTNNFSDLVKKSNMFIDNSVFIVKLLQHIDYKHPAIIIAPTKWGKSTALDMLKFFLQIQVDEEGNEILFRNSTTGYKLFSNGEIIMDDGRLEKLRNPLQIVDFPQILNTFQGKHPVVHFSFENVSGENYMIIVEKIRAVIGEAYKKHDYMIKVFEKTSDRFPKQDQQKFIEYLHNSDSVSIEESINFLCKILHKHFNRWVYVLVDDYDRPIFSALKYSAFSKFDAENTFKLVFGLMQNIFYKESKRQRGALTGTFSLDNAGWKFGNASLARSVMTDRSIQMYLGIEEQNVKILFEQNSITQTLSQLAQKWYDGFQFESRYFHTASIASFLKYKEIRSYREQHWSDEFIFNAFEVWPELRGIILSLISKQTLRLSRSQNSIILPTIVKICDLVDLKEQIENLLPSPEKDQKPLSPKVKVHKTSSIKNQESELQRIFNIFLNFLWGRGYLTKFASEEISLPNNEITFFMSSLMISYYIRHYYIDYNQLENAAAALQNYMKNPQNATNQLEETITILYQRNLNRKLSKHEKSLPKDLKIRSIFNCVVLFLQRQRKFEFDVYYDRVKEADVVIVDNDARMAIMTKFKYNIKVAPPPGGRNFKYNLKNFTNIRSLQQLEIVVQQTEIINVISGQNRACEFLILSFH